MLKLLRLLKDNCGEMAATLTILTFLLMAGGTILGSFVAQRETRIGSQATDGAGCVGCDGPGGLCSPGRGGADLRGCGGFDGCRSWEYCNGTCIDTTNNNTQPPTAQSCGPSGNPTNTPPPGQSTPTPTTVRPGQPTPTPTTPQANGTFHLTASINPKNDQNISEGCNVSVTFVSDGCDGDIRLDRNGQMIAGINGWNSGGGPFTYVSQWTGSPYNPGTTVTFTGWIVNGPRNCGNQSSSLTLTMPADCRGSGGGGTPPTPTPTTGSPAGCYEYSYCPSSSPLKKVYTKSNKYYLNGSCLGVEYNSFNDACAGTIPSPSSTPPFGTPSSTPTPTPQPGTPSSTPTPTPPPQTGCFHLAGETAVTIYTSEKLVYFYPTIKVYSDGDSGLLTFWVNGQQPPFHNQVLTTNAPYVIQPEYTTHQLGSGHIDINANGSVSVLYRVKLEGQNCPAPDNEREISCAFSVDTNGVPSSTCPIVSSQTSGTGTTDIHGTVTLNYSEKNQLDPYDQVKVTLYDTTNNLLKYIPISISNFSSSGQQFQYKFDKINAGQQYTVNIQLIDKNGNQVSSPSVQISIEKCKGTKFGNSCERMPFPFEEVPFKITLGTPALPNAQVISLSYTPANYKKVMDEYRKYSAIQISKWVSGNPYTPGTFSPGLKIQTCDPMRGECNIPF